MKREKKQLSQKTPLYDKTSIIVLAAAAAVFLLVLFWIHSEDILHGAGKIFWAYGDELVEFEKGTVLEIESQDMTPDETAEGAYRGNQKLSVKVGSGQYKGEVLTVSNDFGPNFGVPLSPGDGVALTIKTHENGEHIATVYEYNRIPVLAVFLILFCLVIALIGGADHVRRLRLHRARELHDPRRCASKDDQRLSRHGCRHVPCHALWPRRAESREDRRAAH